MDLSTLLSESQALTAHLAPNDIPSIHLGLEQIEAQSRRLVSRQAAATGDTGKALVVLVVLWRVADELSGSFSLRFQQELPPRSGAGRRRHFGE